MKISTKLFFWFLLVTLVPVFIIGLVIVSLAQNQFSQRIANDLSTVADIQIQRLSAVVARYKDTHNIIAADEELSQLTALRLGTSATAPNPDKAKDLNAALLTLHRKTSISRTLSVLDAQGTVIASTSPAEIGKSRAKKTIQAARIASSIVSSSLPDKSGNLTLRVLGPITYQGEFVGILEMVTVAEPIMNVATNFTGLGETGETILALRTGEGDALFLTPTRFDPNAGMKRKVSRLAFDAPTTLALLKQEKVLISGLHDYRNEHVIAATRYFAPLDWGVVVKIDYSEAFGTIQEINYFFWYALLMSIFISLIFSFEVTREFGKPLARLSNAVAKLEQGDYTARCGGTNRKDEFGLLAKAFNDMAQRVQQSYTKLESKVQERTKKLKENLDAVDHLQAVGQAMLLSIGEAVITTDVHDAITFANPVFEKLFHVPSDQLTSKSIKAALTFYDANGHQDPSFFTKIYSKQKQIWSGVLFVKIQDDVLTPVHISLAPVILRKKLIGHVFVMRDITKEKAVEKAKTEFVSIASHQLRTPLAAINWYVELLTDKKTGKLNKLQKEYSNTILSASKRMVRLVNALLNVSRIETGQLLINSEPHKIEKIFEETFAELKPQIQEKKLFAHLDIQKRLPAVSVDKHLMHIVIQNLLTNAIKYTPAQGAIHASIQKVRAGKTVDKRKIPVDSILLKVEDNGYGIPEHQQDRIFEKLFRADNVVEKPIEGTGLGLYFTHNIIRYANGLIWFKSKEGSGTTFYVSIPLAGMPKHAGLKTLIA